MVLDAGLVGPLVVIGTVLTALARRRPPTQPPQYPNHEVVEQQVKFQCELAGRVTLNIEGKLKEHARKTSTKPLTATKPGENGVADME